VLLLGALCGLLAAAPAATIPNTPAGRQFAHWLEVFNGGKRDEIQKYLEQNHPEEAASIDREMDFRQMTGGFDFVKVEESAPAKITGNVKERDSGNYARFDMEIQPGPPHHVVNFGLELIPRPVATPRLREPDAIAALQAEIQKRTAEDRFAGTVAIAKGRKPVFSGAYGLADREQKAPAKLDTRFRIGSMNKMFTATAILQLAQAGKLQLTDPLGKYLTDYPNKDMALGNGAPASHAHWRHGGYLRTGVREESPHAPRDEGLCCAVRQASSAVRSRRALRIQQLRIHSARRVGRDGVGPELLSIPSRTHLQAGRHDAD